MENIFNRALDISTYINTMIMNVMADNTFNTDEYYSSLQDLYIQS